MLTLAELRAWHQRKHDAAWARVLKVQGEMQRRGECVTLLKNERLAMADATFHQAAVNAIDEEGR